MLLNRFRISKKIPGPSKTKKKEAYFSRKKHIKEFYSYLEELGARPALGTNVN